MNSYGGDMMLHVKSQECLRRHMSWQGRGNFLQSDSLGAWEKRLRCGPLESRVLLF